MTGIQTSAHCMYNTTFLPTEINSRGQNLEFFNMAIKYDIFKQQKLKIKITKIWT
jgi:hypothetical protein